MKGVTEASFFIFILVPICTVSTILHASIWLDHATEYATFGYIYAFMYLNYQASLCFLRDISCLPPLLPN